MARSPVDEERACNEIRTLVCVHQLLASRPSRDTEEKALRCQRVARLVDNRIRVVAELLTRRGAEPAHVGLSPRGDRAGSG